MHRLKILTAVAIVACIGLSACAGGIKPPSPGTQNAIINSISTACSIATVGSAAFDAYVAAKPGRIDAKGIAWKKGVMTTIAPICADPAAVVDPNKALTLVVQIGFALSDYIKGVDSGPAP